MNRHSRSNIVLLELLIIILFFSLSSVVILRLFQTAHQQMERSTKTNGSLMNVQCWAERLYAQEDPVGYLTKIGWSMVDKNEYTRIHEPTGVLLRAYVTVEDSEQGRVCRTVITAEDKDLLLFTLPVCRYFPGMGVGL